MCRLGGLLELLTRRTHPTRPNLISSIRPLSISLVWQVRPPSAGWGWGWIGTAEEGPFLGRRGEELWRLPILCSGGDEELRHHSRAR
jgi:hypothetical protein